MSLSAGLRSAWRQRGWLALALWPLSLPYRALVALRRTLYRWGVLCSERLPVPVIVVGNVIAGGRIQPFASGGIVNSPVLFPLRGGMGLMGEAGPEAIMPLARGRDGRLGVRMAGQGGANITVNISTPDAESFRQSQGQVAALVARAVARGQRNM